MGRQIAIEENGVFLVLEILEQSGSAVLLHCQRAPFRPDEIRENQKDWYRLVEVQAAGEDQDDHHGSKYTGTLPGRRLVFQELRDERNARGRLLTVVQRDAQTGLLVESCMQFMGELPVFESWTRVTNEGQEPQTLTYVSSFALSGLTKSALAPWDQAARLWVPSNTWYGEFQWNRYRLPELGLSRVAAYSTKRLSFSATGTWNSHEFLPMGYVENAESGEGWYFSIVHNGSWQWEVSDTKDALYLRLSGPTENENHWCRTLASGESFESVHAAVAPTALGFEDAAAEITRYRRAVRRKNEDNEKLPVIFNDFMNCLGGDPTAEKEYPLIDAAAAAGCEYFTIDAGWYANGSWWSRVGEWEPSAARFPDGLAPVLAYIREKGMIPGLWLELEVMGIHCPIAAEKPDSWFFCRHGRRVIDHGRYQLDYRNPEVRAFADSVIRRLAEEYGAGYIKMDYNINAGIGTEVSADSAGDGLLGHNRAYLDWLDSVFCRYPNLIIENCGSGGMRINDALLSRHSIQSISDQTEYLRYAAIAAAAPSAVTPEQNAVWSYPMRDADPEAAAFNMVNAMMMRIHQSGHLAALRPESLALVKEGIACYKTYREHLAEAVPFWPLGLPREGQSVFALGLSWKGRTLLAVWNCGGDRVSLSLPLRRTYADAARLYPVSLPGVCRLQDAGNRLSVALEGRTARIFALTETDNESEEASREK